MEEMESRITQSRNLSNIRDMLKQLFVLLDVSSNGVLSEREVLAFFCQLYKNEGGYIPANHTYDAEHEERMAIHLFLQ